MNLIKKSSIVLSLAAMMFATSCDEKFEEMNTNPNQAVDVPATNVLGTIWPSAYTICFSSLQTTDYGAAYSGHIGVADYTYRGTEINDPIWTACYRVMGICENTMKLALEEENDNLYAAALTMKVFFGNKCVNYFGDMPYAEAFNIDEYLHPNYETQKVVYLAKLAELETALSMFDESGEDIGVGDFLFGGNVSKWVKFTNSMRLRLAIRANSGESGLVDDVFTDVMKYPLMLDNEDNAYWWRSGNVEYQEPWYTSGHYNRNADGLKSQGPRAQETLVDLLLEINDPRISSFMEPNQDGVYKGYYMGPGQSANEANNDSNYQLSGVGDYWTLDPAGYTPLMNAAEVYLCLAEAALLGKISGDAQTYYEDGIRTCLEDFKYYTYPDDAIRSATNGTLTSYTDEEIDAYLAEDGVAWGSVNKEHTGSTGSSDNFNKIALQKWIAFYKQGAEAWTENRRTDVPAVTAVNSDNAAMHNRPPFRFPYSTAEASNNENYPTEIGAQEVDVWWGFQLWWDKREGVY